MYSYSLKISPKTKLYAYNVIKVLQMVKNLPEFQLRMPGSLLN